VLAIGGLDPGGGAGVLADARAISRSGAFGCAAVALLTVQSTSGLRSKAPVSRQSVLAQCREVTRHQNVRAIKVGALGTDENVRAVGGFLARHAAVPAIVDPVMRPTRGHARLLDTRAVAVVRERLLPRATLVTANAPEAEALTGMRVARIDEAHDAALELLRLGARAVLLKGGHLRGAQAIDLLAIAPHRERPTEARVVEISAPRLSLPRATHGGGCVLASLIAGRLAVIAGDYATSPERALASAVRWAKRVHHHALVHAIHVGGAMDVLLG
jgi:hydroxymethylpyrimidine/phosphomethylpyrimidine kinase